MIRHLCDRDLAWARNKSETVIILSEEAELTDFQPETTFVAQIDIVSDVMCPWCIVGYRQLEQALALTGIGANVRWHPFELNPGMPTEGQNLAEHLAQKYGASAADSKANRARLVGIGASLGIDFQFTEESRIVNTFDAHQLLDFAASKGLQHPLKLALFDAHFTQGRDVSQSDVLCDIAVSVGMDRSEVAGVLQQGTLRQSVREKQHFWTSRGISGVPSVVFSERYLLTGAQGVQTYAEMLRRTREEALAA